MKKREGFAKRKLKVHFTENVVQHLAATGFDIRYGARPLQRAIEQSLVTPIANWLLKHPEVQNQKLKIDYKDEIIISI